MTEIVFAKVIWVLQKVYRIPRKEISSTFLKLLNYAGLKTVFSKEIFSERLKLYAIYTVDMQDIFLAILARVRESTIISFVKADFKKLKSDFAEP